MQNVLFFAAVILVFGIYTAFTNGIFLRCPYCHKIGAWRFDTIESPIETIDEDGNTQSTQETRICRKCTGKVLDIWSDHEGRTIKKAAE
jgi:pyruvate-formate lyase-activating enzyme